MGKVRADIHHDGDVSCPGDDEAKPVGSDSKAGTEVQDHRVWQPPDHSREGKRRAPARGPWQVIRGRLVAAVKRTVTNAGGVAGEIHCRQVRAGIKRVAPEGSDAVRNRDVRQTGAESERIA